MAGGDVDTRKLYTVAIFAMKPDPEHRVERVSENGISTHYAARQSETDIHYDTTFSCVSGIERATSIEEAREAAMVKAREIYPDSESWTLHSVHVSEIDPLLILEMAASIGAEFSYTADSEEQLIG